VGNLPKSPNFQYNNNFSVTSRVVTSRSETDQGLQNNFCKIFYYFYHKVHGPSLNSTQLHVKLQRSFCNIKLKSTWFWRFPTGTSSSWDLETKSSLSESESLWSNNVVNLLRFANFSKKILNLLQKLLWSSWKVFERDVTTPNVTEKLLLDWTLGVLGDFPQKPSLIPLYRRFIRSLWLNNVVKSAKSREFFKNYQKVIKYFIKVILKSLSSLGTRRNYPWRYREVIIMLKIRWFWEISHGNPPPVEGSLWPLWSNNVVKSSESCEFLKKFKK